MVADITHAGIRVQTLRWELVITSYLPIFSLIVSFALSIPWDATALKSFPVILITTSRVMIGVVPVLTPILCVMVQADLFVRLTITNSMLRIISATADLSLTALMDTP